MLLLRPPPACIRECLTSTTASRLHNGRLRPTTSPRHKNAQTGLAKGSVFNSKVCKQGASMSVLHPATGRNLCRNGCLDLEHLLYEVPQILQLLPAVTLQAVLSVNKLLRSQVHSVVSIGSVDKADDMELLLTKQWPALAQIRFRTVPNVRAISPLSLWSPVGVTVLDFAQAKLKVRHLKVLAQGRWPTLQHLNLSGTDLQGDCMSELQCGKWAKLKTLLIKDCRLDSSSITSLTAAPWHSLEDLQLSSNPMNTQEFQQLCTGPWPDLAKLDLECVFAPDSEVADELDPTFVQYLVQASWPKLAAIRVNHCNLGLGSVQLLVTGSWAAMQDVDLSYSTFSLDMWELLSKAHWPDLRKLDVSVTDLNSEGMQEIIKCDWPALKCLDIAYNRDVDADAIKIMTLAAWPTLEMLNMYACGITNEGLANLMHGKWPLLRVLDINCPGLDITGLDVLLHGRNRFDLLECLAISNISGDALLKLFDPDEQAGLCIGDNYISRPELVASERWPCLKELHFTHACERCWFLTWDPIDGFSDDP